MAGDSIMAEYRPAEWPQYGWGQALKVFMKDPSALHNFARSGWSARRFRESGRWEKCIASKLKPGDWAIVSFGHNDMNRRRNKPPKNDYSTIDEYKEFLRGFAADAKAKGANIAFATSIAHSSGFSAKGAAMTVDGGATGLGPYVAAMREVAAELNAPLLDLNRYAEENLPGLGLEKAKSLYMFVSPGEYENYPKGKHDAAHIRDRGAFFYAKAAVEMARSQNLSLAAMFKDPSSVPFVPPVAPVTCARSQTFNAVSPDGLNEVRLEIGENGMKYSVWRRGKAIVEPTELALKVGVSWLNGREVSQLGTEVKTEERKVEGTLATPIYKKSAIDLAANETKVDFGDWAVRLHARNDGLGGAAPRAQRRRGMAVRDGVWRQADASDGGIDHRPLPERRRALLHGRARLHVGLGKACGDWTRRECPCRASADRDDAVHGDGAGRGCCHGDRIRPARLSWSQLLPARGRDRYSALMAGGRAERCGQRPPKDKSRGS